MSKKFVVMVVTTLLLLVLFAGCDGGNDGGGTTTPSGSTTPNPIYVTLQAGWSATSNVGGATGIYGGDSTNPTQHATIDYVTNPTGYTFSLAHGNSAFYIMNPHSSCSTCWPGYSVQGHWTAQLSGDLTNPPSTISIEVHWK